MKIKSLVITASLLTAVSASAWADDADSAAVAAAQAETQSVVDGLNQNMGRYAATGIDWTKFVTLHGGMTVDGMFGDNEGSAGVNSEKTSLTDVYLATMINPNDWVNASLDLNYNDASSDYNLGNSSDHLMVDQAFITFGNMSQRPLFLQVGKQYLPFGSYDLNPMVKSLTQVLSESNQDDAQLGFMSDRGFYGSFYSFQNPSDFVAGGNSYNWGATVGMNRSTERMDISGRIGYLNNMYAVTSVADTLSGGFAATTSALSANLRLSTGPFGFGVNHVTALDEFAATDSNLAGDKPSATDVTIDYSMKMQDMDTKLRLGYETSSDADELDMAESRVSFGVDVTPWADTVLGFEVDRDSAYDENGGEDSYTFGFRGGVKF